MSAIHSTQINGKSKIIGVLGRNIGFTLSPAIHNFSARRLRINSVCVPLFLDSSDVLTDTLRFLQASNFIGLSVTTPYKQEVARLLKSKEPSVNLVYRDGNGELQATSTDGAGFWQGLGRIVRPEESMSEVIILGNGGVCAALLHYFQREKLPVKKISILRRNASRDQRLVEINARFCQLSFHDFTLQNLVQVTGEDSSCQLLIQATSAPQYDDDLQHFCPALMGFSGTFVDLVYGQPSALYREAKAKGIPCQDGLPMLIEQALLGQEIWWGKHAPYTEVAEYLRNTHLSFSI